MATDKFKSRILLKSLVQEKGKPTAQGEKDVFKEAGIKGTPNPGAAEVMFKKAEPHFMELVRDQYGNYLSQKILEVSTAEQFEILFGKLKGILPELAQDVHGTRAVQKVVEQAIARGKLAELLQAVPGESIEKLAKSATGFHVIVKLLESLPAKEVEDVLELLCGTPEKALALGTDQWGCCVLKKCCDRSDGEMRAKIIDAVADNTLTLVQDAFGNYVVQHLILMRPPNSAIPRIIDAMRGKVLEMSLQKFSSNVLEKCLLHSTDKDRNKIINEILNPPDNYLPSEAVRTMIFHPYGNYVFQQALEVSKDPQFSLLIEHSKGHIQELVRNTNATPPAAAKDKDAEQNLASEHARRLAMKLVKKYPALSEGLVSDTDRLAGLAGGWAPEMYNAMGYPGYGFDGYGQFGMSGGAVYSMPPAFMPWDPSAAMMGGLPMMGGYPAATKGGGKGRGGGGAAAASKRGGQSKSDGQGAAGKKGPKQAAAAAPAASGPPVSMPVAAGSTPQTLRVGRIVGYWPNYTITYDEVPAPGGATTPGGSGGGGGGGGGRNKGKNQRTKAAAKKGPAPGA
eukprot:gnl/TRDRNA2_/TRDRNA2_190949_c0_seq1.p1 gnl/TRDRNA2_/TRDRNA2_190949_c0~~gnl/TRDRNA2_/TRDRNA2_190949_c0_seq1.p1  ORF type:complete len:625 (-),score=160.63 gnl/TRDRNA2_/TRDRNA2_190949_c0_seq1:107-1807(-)